MQTVPRLFKAFQPSHYNLLLALERTARTFSGTVIIDGEQSGNEIVLHAKELKITDTSVDDTPVPFTIDTKADTLTLDTSSLAIDGEVRVLIEFTGAITDPMHGLYPCYYELDGVKKELLATQFESHHAREVFPCVDEPEAKATFDLTLMTEKDVVALSNMPVSEQLTKNEQLVTRFESSPLMSPYLLAFVVGDMHSKSIKTVNGVDVTLWATKAQSLDGFDFGLDIAKRSIEYFEDYFGVKYPLPKADHVALPDFSSAAMENWGLVTYRESCLLADDTTAISTKQWIATVIAHETSHQWFGNLVTMQWWDDLWLNESFASLMETVCVDALFPEWDIWTSFVNMRVLSALRRDYLPGIQAVKIPVNHPDEISTLFDASIVYSKGARTLVMLREFVGEAAWRAGLSEYFKTHAYRNTTGDDLWRSLSSTSGKDVNAFMKPWLEQSGMPVVRATHSRGTLTLAQQHFVIPSVDDELLWPIPLNAQPAAIPELLDTKHMEITLTGDDLVLINRDATAHAIVSYDDALRAKLEAALEQDGALSEIDRLSLLHDMSLLARAGEQTATSLLALLKRYSNETAEAVWDIIALVIADLRRLIEQDDVAEAAMKVLVADLALPNYKRLGWTEVQGEKESDTKLRATTISLLGYSEHQDVITKSLEAFRATTSALELPGELRTTILSLVVKHGDATDIERIINEHRTTISADLQDDLAAGLTATKDTQLIEELIGFFTDKNVIRPQDLFRWFAYLIRNRYGKDMTWEWMKDNWSWIETTFAGDKSYDDFARYSASALGTHDWLKKYDAFFNEKRSENALARAIELGIADITVRADWYERDAASLCELLKSQATS